MNIFQTTMKMVHQTLMCDRRVLETELHSEITECIKRAKGVVNADL